MTAVPAAGGFFNTLRKWAALTPLSIVETDVREF
jgi:hypothetical protein